MNRIVIPEFDRDRARCSRLSSLIQVRSSIQWSVKWEGTRWIVFRPRESIWGSRIEFHLSQAEAVRWHRALTRIALRIREERFRALPVTQFWRCVLGYYRGGARHVQCYGGMQGSMRQVVGVGDRLLMIVEGCDWAGYPITLEELTSIGKQLA